MSGMRGRVASFVVVMGLFGCSMFPTHQQRVAAADQLASQKGWRARVIHSGQFEIMSYMSNDILPRQDLTVYIEGDGLAWLSNEIPSNDPTPINPIGLKLALAQPSGQAVYLGRPCQYADFKAEGSCGKRYWTNERFAPEVIMAMSMVLDQLKLEFNPKRLTLVGYSGGGAIAVLLAAKRTDVAQLITIAGNLDTEAWTAYHGISPLAGSLNPADAYRQLTHTPQIHWVGGADETMPKQIADHYLARFDKTSLLEIRVMDGYTHQCCWVRHWPELWQKFSEY